MKILFISHSSKIGGAEKSLFNLLKFLPKDKLECHCLFPNTGPLEKKVNSLGIKTYISNLRWWINRNKNPIIKILDFCQGLKERTEKIVEIIRMNNIDLVITNTIVVGDGAIAAKMIGVPHIWYVRELLSSDTRLRSALNLRHLYSIILSLSDYIIAVSKAVKEEIENFVGSSSKIKVIYNQTSTKELSLDCMNNSKKGKVVFAAGNICRRKGFMILLKAAKYVHNLIPEVKFIIAGSVGEKDYYKSLQIERKRLCLQKNFIFCGFQQDLHHFYQNSSIVVLPSLSDAFPRVILEAASFGRPVVATNCGGSSELIVDGKTGFLVPVNDAKKMAEKIIYLLKNDEIAAQIGKAGYERVKENFNSEKLINEFLDLLRRIPSQQNKKTENAHLRIEKIIEIIDNIGMEKENIQEIFHFYNRINNSFPYKIYKNLGLLKYPIRKLIGIK